MVNPGAAFATAEIKAVAVDADFAAMFSTVGDRVTLGVDFRKERNVDDLVVE